MSEKVDEVTHAPGLKRKFQPSFVDFIINKNTEESSISAQPKLQCLDSSIIDYCENNDASTSVEVQKSAAVDECNMQPSDQKKDKKDEHSLIKIPSTKRKKYAQKVCVHCRQKYGVRNDTRYICVLCQVALCKEPCFSNYHRETNNTHLSAYTCCFQCFP